MIALAFLISHIETNALFCSRDTHQWFGVGNMKGWVFFFFLNAIILHRTLYYLKYFKNEKLETL